MPVSSNPSTNTKKPVLRTLFHRMVNPSMEREVQSNLRRMQNPTFGLISRSLEARLAADASFGKFGEKSALSLGPVQIEPADPETAKGP